MNEQDVAKVVSQLVASAPAAVVITQTSLLLKDMMQRICRPIADAVGSDFAERYQAWRLQNLNRPLHVADELLTQRKDASTVHANPRVVVAILDHSSVVDVPELQEMWGGLLASSCTANPDDENIVFINLLSQLTAPEARLLAFAAEHSDKRVNNHGLVYCVDILRPDIAELMRVAQVTSISRIDRELDQLRNLGLIDGGLRGDDFAMSHSIVSIELKPTVLGLTLFARCHGSTEETASFFNLEAPASDTLTQNG